jgi:hypothetical protein
VFNPIIETTEFLHVKAPFTSCQSIAACRNCTGEISTPGRGPLLCWHPLAWNNEIPGHVKYHCINSRIGRIGYLEAGDHKGRFHLQPFFQRSTTRARGALCRPIHQGEHHLISSRTSPNAPVRYLLSHQRRGIEHLFHALPEH